MSKSHDLLHDLLVKKPRGVDQSFSHHSEMVKDIPKQVSPWKSIYMQLSIKFYMMVEEVEYVPELCPTLDCNHEDEGGGLGLV